MSDDDPISHAARWRPRPQSLEVRRATGEVETFAVSPSRRAWGQLRALVPPDVVELVGRREGNIVGRWVAPEPSDIPPPEPFVVDDAAPPDEDARAMRWAAREVRGIYGDTLRAWKEVVSVLADALRVQREVMLHMPIAPAPQPPDEDAAGYSQVSDLLSKAMALMAAQQAARPQQQPQQSPQPNTPPEGFRNSQ